MTKLIKERVDDLEKEIAELKLIVHELRKPSTVVQEEVDKAEWQRGEIEGVIEFEGKQYKKVDRLAREGDLVVFRSENIPDMCLLKKDKPYRVIPFMNKLCVEHDKWNHYEVYIQSETSFRTPETVDVYELIEQPISEAERISRQAKSLNNKPKTPNQLRAEIIEKARQFVDATATDDTHFEIEGNQVLAWRIIRKGTGYDALTGVAVCSPNDVFNEHIGCAIAVGRMEGLDVSEFEQAVQPTEIEVGMEIMTFNASGEKHKSGVVESYDTTKDEARFSDEVLFGRFAAKNRFFSFRS